MPASPGLHSSSCWGTPYVPGLTEDTHTHTCTYTLSHTFCLDRNSAPQTSNPVHPFYQSYSLPVCHPSPAAASTLATLLPACPARFQGSSCQVGPLIVVPSFLLIPAGLLDTVGTNPSAAAVVSRSSTRIGYVRYGAGLYTHPHAHAHVQPPLQVAFLLWTQTSQNDKGTGRGTDGAGAQDWTGQPRQNGTMAVPRIYLPAPVPSPSPSIPTYISPLPSLCK